MTRLAIIVLCSTIAHAAPLDAVHELARIKAWLAAVKKDYAAATTMEFPARCPELATTPDAAKPCAEATLLHDIVLRDYPLFATMASDLGKATFDPSFALAQADKCVAAVDAMLAAKVKPAFPYVLRDPKKRVVVRTVAQLRPALCEATRAAATRYAKKLEAERKAKDARIEKSGLAADKLDWYRHYDGKVFLAGGVQPTDLKKLAAADVWFAYVVDTKPDRNGHVQFTVRRYTFAGNKLQTTTETEHWQPRTFESSIGTVMKN